MESISEAQKIIELVKHVKKAIHFSSSLSYLSFSLLPQEEHRIDRQQGGGEAPDQTC